MRVAVESNLVPGGDDLADALWVALGNSPGNEEGGNEVMLRKQLDDQGTATLAP